MVSLAIFVGSMLGFQSDNTTSQQDRAVVAATDRFELRSDPRVALHHFLIDWASADAGQWPLYAMQLAERDDWQSVLDAEERRAWSAAVEAYAGTPGRSLVFDEGLIAVRAWAASPEHHPHVRPAARRRARARPPRLRAPLVAGARRPQPGMDPVGLPDARCRRGVHDRPLRSGVRGRLA